MITTPLHIEHGGHGKMNGIEKLGGELVGWVEDKRQGKTNTLSVVPPPLEVDWG